MSQLQVTGEAKIRDLQGPVVSNSGVISALDGDASQYVRGDGTLADFPTSTGGGSSVSYYLNSSVSQGTIGGVAYSQLGKTPIAGAGTDITISANGYVASYITDANDPALLEVPAGNFNCEFYFSVNSDNHNPYVYAEVYKYDGTTFSLIGTSVGVPEYLSNGTTLSPYYFAIPVSQTVLTITDRIAIRIYVNVDGRVVTLHTENGHLCQVVTTFSKGLTSLNNLTRQVQFLGTGTSGTDFNISSVTATHTFNLPIASASNTGKLSSSDWSVFNAKQAALSFTAPLVNTSNTISIPAASASVDGYLDNLDWTKFNTAYNDSIISAAVTGTTTKTLTLNQQDGGTITASWTDDNTDAVTSVFGRTGAVVAASGDYTTTQVTEGTNLYYTEARVNANSNVAANTAARHNAVTIGTANGLSLSTQVLSLSLASTNTTGALSSTDWTTFNNKQNALTNPVTGTGSTNTLPKFTGASTIGNSNVTDSGTLISFGADTNFSGFSGGSFTKVLPAGNTFGGLANGVTGTFTGSANGWAIVSRQTWNINDDAFTFNGFTANDTRIIINRSATSSNGYSVFAGGLTNNGSASQFATIISAQSGGTGNFSTVVAYKAGASGPQSNTNTYTNYNCFKAEHLPQNITNFVGISINDYTATTTSRALDLNLTAGTSKYNIYAGGTANNYMAGDTGIGTANLGTATKLTTGGTETAVSAIARGQLINTTLVASANNDVLVGLDINNTFTNGAFTGVQNFGLRVNGKIYSSGGSLDIGRNASSTPQTIIFADSTETTLMNNATNARLAFRLNSTDVGRFFPTTGNFTIQNGGTFTDAGFRLDVNGTGRFSGELTGTKVQFLAGSYGAIYANNFTGNGTFAYGSSTAIRFTRFAYNAGDQMGVELGYDVTNNNGIIAGATQATGSGLDFWTFNGSAWGSRFIIAKSGAATFSSSVTATSFEVGNGQYFKARRASGNLLLDLLGIESGTDNTRLLITGDFNIKNGSLSTLFNMTTTGAATYSSSVSMTGALSGFGLSYRNPSGTLISGFYTTGGGNSQLYFYNSSSIEKVLINSAGDSYFLGGNVGIGTASPASLLDLASGFPQLTLTRTDNSSNAAAAINFSSTSTVRWQIATNSAVGTGFEINQANGSTNRFYINTSGNVGIGNAADGTGYALELARSSSTPRIDLVDNSVYTAQLKSNGGIVTLQNSSNNALIFGTNNTERMRITSGGNVGIGTSSPLSFANTLTLHMNGGSNGSFFTMAGNNTRYLTILAQSGEGKIETNTAIPLIFATNETERMRITSGGRVNIGNNTSTNSTYVLSINSTIADSHLLISGSAPMVRFGNAVSGSTNTALFGMATAANNYVTGTAAGDFVITSATASSKIWVQAVSAGVYLSAGSTSWTANSDIRLKDINGNISNAVEKLSTLSTINFCWKDDVSKKENLGLIAQEVKEVFPELIEENSNGILGVRYTELVPVLIAAIKELKQELEIIKKQVK